MLSQMFCARQFGASRIDSDELICDKTDQNITSENKLKSNC